MMRTALAFLVAALLCLPAGAVATALDFGGFAWLVTLVVVLLLASLVDREGFWGPRDPG